MATAAPSSTATALPATTALPRLIASGADRPMPIGRILRAYLSEVRYESLRVLRSPGFAIPFLLLPAPMYLLFGVVLVESVIAEKPAVANYLFAGWLVFAAMGPAIFGVGCGLALERDAGFLKLKRALPAPGGALIVAKMAMALIVSALAMVLIVAAALVAGKISLSGGQLIAMVLVMLIGTAPFSAIGLFIGAHVSGSASPAIGNLIFLPMLWLGGLFFPLPKFLEQFVVVWPAFHLDQLGLAAAGLKQFQYLPPQISAGVLAGITVLFGGLAIRRLARKG